MKLPRRHFLHLAAGAAALPAASRLACAQSYPSRQITMIVPFAAGGPADTVGRILAERMRTSLGQTVVIENVPGAGGSIGVGRVARAAPDGYTFGMGISSTQVVNPVIYSLPYDVQTDFEPITLLASNPHFIVAKKANPANDLKEFIAWLKANPDKASAGTAGAGSPPHVGAVFFQNLTGTRFGYVPYRGGGPAMQDLVAGTDRHDGRRAGDRGAATARRHDQGLRPCRQEPARERAQRAHDRRSRASRIPFLGVVCVPGAQRHAEADGRPPQRRGG